MVYSGGNSNNIKSHVSYSLHSIKVQPSIDDRNNNYVYYEMIKENESNESRSEKAGDMYSQCSTI